MINFIICDDNVMDAKKVKKLVTKYMHKLDYKIYVYYDYDEKFLDVINKEMSNKIYILDIETPSMSGIDVARKIRKNDYSSAIIFLTGHDDLSRVVAKSNLMCLNYINKFDDLEGNLYKSLGLALSIVGKKRRVKLYSKGIIYNLELDKILYITRDTLSRESIIVCDNATYYLRLNMKDIINELTDDFIQIHRSCFANKNRIKKLDLKEMCIIFDNSRKTTLVSRRYVEGMMKICLEQ